MMAAGGWQWLINEANLAGGFLDPDGENFNDELVGGKSIRNPQTTKNRRIRG